MSILIWIIVFILIWGVTTVMIQTATENDEVYTKPLKVIIYAGIVTMGIICALYSILP